MKRAGYQGSYLIGFIVIAVVTIRTLIHFQGTTCARLPDPIARAIHAALHPGAVVFEPTSRVRRWYTFPCKPWW